MKSRGHKRRQARKSLNERANKLHHKEGITRSKAKEKIKATTERVEKTKLPSNCEIIKPDKKSQNMNKVFNPFKKGFINKDQARTLKELKIRAHRNMTEKEALKLLKSK